ncbi:MAG: EamA family transporter [Thermodesulfobacteriota bacterium]
MPAELFALSNAFFFALHNMLTKKGLKYSNPHTAVFTSLTINVAVLWTISLLLLPIELLTVSGIFIFVIVGLFQPGLTRLLTYKSIETVGVAITDPLRATTPMFSAFLAILLLGEEMTGLIFFATLLIITGIILLSLRGEAAKNIRARYYFYPLLASFLAGSSQILRKFGLGAMPHPILAAAVTATSSLVIVSLTVWISSRRKETLVLNRRCLPFYLAAGLAISLGMVTIYYALDLGKVVVVIPITSSGPLFSLTLTVLFLRGVERVTLKIVLGAVLIISGVILLTVWR